MQIFITEINTQESDFVAVFVPKIPPSNVCSEANPLVKPTKRCESSGIRQSTAL